MLHNNLRRAQRANLPTSADTTLVVIVRHLALLALLPPAPKKILAAEHFALIRANTSIATSYSGRVAWIST
jgi:hypothetical protein